jgi:cytoskeletal protein CcmA (bactofilin family)
MIVGRETAFTGEIRSCNRLVVEGTVEGKLDNCQHILIEESGVFRGEASTENSDVRGSFDGVLVARKRLLVRATGRVSGTITYAEIEIEPGGRVFGHAPGAWRDRYAGRAARPGCESSFCHSL